MAKSIIANNKNTQSPVSAGMAGETLMPEIPSNIYSFTTGKVLSKNQSEYIDKLKSRIAAIDAELTETIKKSRSSSHEERRLKALLIQHETPLLTQPEDIEDTFDSGLSLYENQHLKFGLEKYV